MNIKEGEVYLTPNGKYWVCIKVGDRLFFGRDSIDNKDKLQYKPEQLYAINVSDQFIFINVDFIYNLSIEDVEDPLFERNYQYIGQINNDQLKSLEKCIDEWNKDRPKESITE